MGQNPFLFATSDTFWFTFITLLLSSRATRGLAVIDWEEWRPLWDRNWGTKRIYQTLSVAHVMQANLSLTAEQATVKAKQQFQVRALYVRFNDKLYIMKSCERLLINHVILASFFLPFFLPLRRQQGILCQRCWPWAEL